jgi:3-carboxy-cis,cis-muconate cycloisomerase
VTELLDALVGDDEIAAHFSDDADLRAMLRAEAALAEAEAEAGLVTAAAAARIGAACATFRPDWDGLRSGMARDGVVVPALVRQLRGAVGAEHGPALHRGATSQDIIDTSLMLRLGAVADLLASRIDALLAGLSALAGRDGTKRLMAHTRMQAALPVTAADKVTGWRQPLERCRERLADLRPRLLVLQLGGPVGTRDELGPQAERIAAGMAERLGLTAAPPWHAQRDRIVEFGSWLSLLAGTLGKFGQDVALLAQTEVAAVTIAGAGSSSAMAHKQNPVAAEVLVALARFAAGLAGTLHQALVHENERSGAAWTLEWMVLPRLAITAGASLRTAVVLVGALTFT